MESKKINQLATNVNPQTSDLTTIGDPITGQLKKITWLQVANLIGAQASVTLQQVTDNGNTTTDPITTAGLTLTNLGTGVPQLTNGNFAGTYGYGLANGVATLDSGGKIPASQLPSSVMEYKGTWNASTNTPTLADGTGDNGDVYLVNVAGSQNLGSGTISFAVGDWVVYNGTIWQKSLNSNAVASVFGRTGTIVAQEGDYNIDQLGDVAITTPATNDYLRYNGSGWVNTPFPSFVSSDKLVLQVRNTSGATINKGTVVYVNGASGGYPTIAKAQADADNTSAQTLGLVQDNISNNSNGVVVIVGQITGIDTSAYPSGTQLYLSGTTAGAFTSTKTLAPTHLVYVGIVTTQNAVNGVIEVKIQNGYELDEIHDVAISSVANNQGLFYESSTSLWKNKSIATVLGYTPEQPLTFSAPLSRSTNTVSIPAATGSVNGYLTSTDWTTFNNKLTSPMTTLGDIIFGGTSGNANRLAGNITTTKQYLSQTGTGTESASPTWATITGSDITGAALTKSDDTNVTLTLGGTPATALLRAASLTLGWTGTLAVSRGGTGASSFGSNEIIYGNSASALQSSSQFTFSPTGVFFINNTISAGGIAMNLVSTVNAAANNDIIYGVRISPTFNNGAFTGVTQRALGVFGNVYINGTITGAGWGGSVIGSNYGGAGTVSGILKANGSGVVSAAVAGTDYQAPLTNPVTGTGSASRLAYWNGANSITSTSLLNVDTTNSALVINATGIAAYGGVQPKLEVYGSNMTSADPDGGNIVIYGTANTGNSGSSIALGSSYGTGYGTFARVRGVKANSTAGDTGGGIALDVRPSNTGFQQALFINSVGAASFASSVSANGIITANNNGASDSILQSVSSFADGYRATLRLNNTHTGGKSWEIYSTNSSDGVYGGGRFAIRNATDNVYAFNMESGGSATFNLSVSATAFIPRGSTVPTVGMYSSTTNYLDFSTNSTRAITISDGQKVGIGADPISAYRLYVNGDTNIAGTLSAGIGSFSSAISATEGNFTSQVTITTDVNIMRFGNLARWGFRRMGADNRYISFIRNANATASAVWTVDGDNGNVGIGTTSPTNYSLAGKFLDINGGSDYAFYVATTTNAQGFWAMNNALNLGALFMYTNSPLTFGTNNTERMRITSAGDMYLTGRSTNGDYGMYFYSNDTDSRIYSSNSGAVSKSLIFYTSGSPRMTITSGGAVQATNNLTANSPSAGNTGEGIIAGTSFKIDASGTGQKAKMYVVSKDLSDTYGSGLQIQFANQADDKGFGFNLNTSGGYETYTKHTNGLWKRRYVINQNGAFVLRDIDETGGRRFFAYEGGTGNANGFGLDMGGNSYEASIFFAYGVSDSGRLTFGSHDGTTYRTKMTVYGSGNIGAPTGSNIYNASDLRLKQNINTIDNGLSKILALNPVKFNWINNYISEENDKDMLGFIAQEVAKIIPEAVEGFSDGQSIKVGDKIINSPLRVNEKFIIPVIVKAIQELNAKLEAK